MHRLSSSAVILALLVACTQKDETAPPEVASAAEQENYATDYPEALGTETERVDESKSTVGTKSDELASYPDQLKDPTDYNVAAESARAADRSGRSQAYVEQKRKAEQITDFLAEDDGVVAKKVAGGVQYAAKQQGCSAELGGVAAGQLKRAVEDRLKEDLQEANEAYAVIERNEDKIGKDNVPTLQKQADTIAEASYAAHVELPTRKARLLKMIKEGSDVKATLDRRIEEEKKLQAKSDTSDKAKKASEERVKELEEAKQKIDEKLEAAKERVKQLDVEIEEAKKKYDKALDALLDELEKRAKDQPKPES